MRDFIESGATPKQVAHVVNGFIRSVLPMIPPAHLATILIDLRAIAEAGGFRLDLGETVN